MIRWILRITTAFAGACAMLSVSIDAGAAGTKGLKDLEATLGKGVRCFLMPSEEYPPGTIFRVDRKNVSYIVNSGMVGQINTKNRAAEVGSVNGTKTLNIGLIAALFDLKKSDQALASVKASLSRKRTAATRLDGVVYETTEDVEVDKVLGWFSAYQGKKPKNTYYIVREGIVATGVAIELGKNLVADFGGEGKLKDAVQLSPTVKYESTSNYELTRELKPPMRLCIKPEKIELDGSGIAGPVYKAKPVNKLPDITHGGRDE